MDKYDNSFLQIKFLRILLYEFLRVPSEAVSVLFYWCPIKVFLASRLNLLAIFYRLLFCSVSRFIGHQ